MRAGLLNKQISLQSPTTTAGSDFADPQTSWTTVATVWAGIEPIAGREYTAMRQTQDEVTHRVRMRYYEGISPKWRVLFGSRVFDVVSVLNIHERNREMHLMCRELVNG